MDKETKKDLKRAANEIKVQFQLGKAGVTDTFIDGVDKYLEAHGIVKIKVLIASTTGDASYFADEVAQQTKSEVLDKKGYTFVLYRELK